MNKYQEEIINAGTGNESRLVIRKIRTATAKLIFPFLSKVSQILKEIDSKWDQVLSDLDKQQRLLRSEFYSYQNTFNFQIEKNIQEIANLKSQVNEFVLAEEQSKNNNENSFSFDIEKSCYLGGVAITKHGIFVGKKDDLIFQELTKSGVWDQHIIDAVHRNISHPNGVALDIGAHIGSLSIPLSKIFSEVHSYEANDFTFQLLQANKMLNNIQNLFLNNKPVYSSKSMLSLSFQDQQETRIPIDDEGSLNPILGTNTGAYAFNTIGSGIFQREATTIDALDLKNVTFIKIDAQGADLEIIEGAKETLLRDKPLLVFEYEKNLSKNHSATFEEIQNWMSSIGYKIEILKEHNEKQIDFICRYMA